MQTTSGHKRPLLVSYTSRSAKTKEDFASSRLFEINIYSTISHCTGGGQIINSVAGAQGK